MIPQDSPPRYLASMRHLVVLFIHFPAIVVTSRSLTFQRLLLAAFTVNIGTDTQ